MTDVSENDRRVSALPPAAARAIAFVGVLLGGIAGGVIGYALVDVQCTGDCTLATGLGLFVGAVVTAGGMAIVGVLALRAMGEWHEIRDRERAGHAP